MIALIFILVFLGVVVASILSTANTLSAKDPLRETAKDMTERGIVSLTASVKSFVKDKEQLPQSMSDIIPTYGFPPKSFSGAFWNYQLLSTAQGLTPSLCLSGTVASRHELDGIRQGALNKGGVFSINPVCGEQTNAELPSRYPSYFSVTYFISVTVPTSNP